MSAIIRTAVRERIAEEAQLCAAPSVAEAVEHAISLAQEALAEDGSHSVDVKVGLTISISYWGGEWEFSAEAKAERKKTIKTKPRVASYDPTQPDLDFGESEEA